MARITLPVIAIAVAFSALPGALAGPACTNKQWNSVDECIQKCNNKWGWAGHIMGSDPWGVVVKPASGTDDPKKAVETACKAKFSGSHSTSAASTTKSSTSTSVTPIINAQSAPPTDSTTSTEKISTSTSSTASRITTVRTTSTPSTTSTTASTTSSTSRGLATIANTTFSKAEGNTALAEETSKSLPPKSTISQEPETTSTPPPKTITKAPPPPKTTSTPPPKTTSVDTGDDDDNKGDNNGGNNNGNNGGNNNGNNDGGNNGSNNGGGNGGSNNGGSSSGGGSVSAADQQRYLNAHNSVRAQHGAGALSWADDLEAAAQKWANNCVFKHSGGTLGPFGENLAAGTGNSYTIETAVKSWTDEVSDFHANNPQPSHFTQVVWKASTQVGCAVADCDGIFDSSFGKAHFHVCEYRSQGNVIGQFAQNVQA